MLEIFLNTNSISLKNKDLSFFLLILTGLLLRGLYLFEYSHFANFDLAIGADIGEYFSRSQEILKGKFFPDSPEIHAPLYSFFLAGVQKTGLGVVAIRIIQTLLNFFSWIVLFFLLRKAAVSEKISFIFLVFAMCLAPLIFHPAELISESLLLPLLTVVFMFFYLEEAQNQGAYKFSAFPAGIFAALALLTHGMISGFLVLQTLFLLFKKKWFSAILFSCGILLLTVPFIAVKSCHYGKFSGVQANTGFNIFLGNNPKANGTCYIRPGNTWRKIHFQADRIARDRQISTDRYWLEQAADFWLETPLKALSLYRKKLILIFSGNDLIAGADGGFLFCRTGTMNLLRFLTFPVFFLVPFGVWQLYRKKLFCWSAPLILCLSLVLMQLLTVTSGRYRLLMFPGVIYLAAAGAVFFPWKKWWIAAAAVFWLSVWKTYSFVAANQPEAAALLGQAHFQKGNFDHAEELLHYAGKRFADSSRIENMLGNIAEQRKDLVKAREFYTKVVQKEPFMPEGWMNLANVTPEPEKAGFYFSQALKASAPSPGADLLFNYAKFLYAVKKRSEAEKYLAMTLKNAPDHVMALNLSGVIAAEKGGFAQASKLFLQAAQLKPGEAGFWKNTAITAKLSENLPLERMASQKYRDLIRKSVFIKK